jgi:hypothetical protein
LFVIHYLFLVLALPDWEVTPSPFIPLLKLVRLWRKGEGTRERLIAGMKRVKSGFLKNIICVDLP